MATSFREGLTSPLDYALSSDSSTLGTIGVTIVFICFFIIMILIIKTLWNTTVPRVFTGVGEVDFWDVIILMILAGVFIK